MADIKKGPRRPGVVCDLPLNDHIKGERKPSISPGRALCCVTECDPQLAVECLITGQKKHPVQDSVGTKLGVWDRGGWTP